MKVNVRAVLSTQEGVLNMPSTQSSPWLTVTELARFLSVPPSWIYSRTYRGARDPLPYKRVGRWLRFDIGEVQAWIDERTQQEREGKAADVNGRREPPRLVVTALVHESSALPFRTKRSRTKN